MFNQCYLRVKFSFSGTLYHYAPSHIQAKQVVEEVSSVKGAEKQTSIAPTVEDIEEKEADKTEKNKETEAKPSAVVDKVRVYFK